MQPGLFIEVLVLKLERLMGVPIDAFIFFQTTPGGVFAVPYEIAVDAVAVVVVAHQFLTVEGDGAGRPVGFQTTSMSTSDEVVQRANISDDLLRSFEKQKPHRNVLHSPHQN